MEENVSLELFENPRMARDYVITTKVPEFTSVCPVTGQPDFGTITIEYCPDKVCFELKSFKFYMQSFRNKGIYYESLTNEILDFLVDKCQPRWMRVSSEFTPRGGISTSVTCEYASEAFMEIDE